MPQVNIWDFFLNADLDAQYKDGIFSANVDVRKLSKATFSDAQLVVEVSDNKGNIVFNQQKQIANSGDTIQTIAIGGNVNQPLQWNAETPYLYYCVIGLTVNGKTVYTATKLVSER